MEAERWKKCCCEGFGRTTTSQNAYLLYILLVHCSLCETQVFKMQIMVQSMGMSWSGTSFFFSVYFYFTDYIGCSQVLL